MRPLTLQRLFVQCGILALVLLVVVAVALKLGAVPVSLYGLSRDLLQLVLGHTRALSSDYNMIVVEIRLPRILLSIVVGASLAVAGTSFQALLRNPLADPYVLGVSSGAALGAIIALITEPYLGLPTALAVLLTPIGASIGGGGTPSPPFFFLAPARQKENGAIFFPAPPSCFSFFPPTPFFVFT